MANWPMLQTADEQRRSFELLRKVLATIDQWGKAQSGKSREQLDRMVMDGLLESVTAICISRELTALNIPHAEVQAFLRRIYKSEGPVKPEDTDTLLRLQARKDILLSALKRAVSVFAEAANYAEAPAPAPPSEAAGSLDRSSGST